MRLRHFYHVFAAGGWKDAVTEHAEALGKAGWRSPVTVGLVGEKEDQFRARERITSLFRWNGVPVPDTWIEADAGFEQVTLTALRDYAISLRDEEAILYAHTKGALSNAPLNEHWRRSMTRHVVGRWVHCYLLLVSGYDTAGCHWLTPERYNDPPDWPVTTPMYGGNFWWARSGYLKRLPPLGDDYRHQAEEWVGLGNPKAADLLPGWPSMKIFDPEGFAARGAADELAEYIRDLIAQAQNGAGQRKRQPR
jgi:hypothetical protein